jgi:hypothetical protein
MQVFLAGWRVTVLLLALLMASAASADSRVYTMTAGFNLIAGATSNLAGHPTDPRLLPSITPVGEFTTAASGSVGWGVAHRRVRVVRYEEAALVIHISVWATGT